MSLHFSSLSEHLILNDRSLF